MAFRAIASATYWPSTMIVDAAAVACAHRNESAMSMKCFMTRPPSLGTRRQDSGAASTFHACVEKIAHLHGTGRLLHCGISVPPMTAQSSFDDVRRTTALTP